MAIDALTENEVVKAVAEYLSNSGYTIDRQCSTSERGIDIEAVEAASGRRLLVEAKGGTSSKSSTKRFDRGFTPAQAKSHVSVAFYCVAKLLQRHENSQVAMAFPDDAIHRRLVNEISVSLKALKINVYFVNTNREVSILSFGA